MYKYYNPNPVKEVAGDCTVRAISKATGRAWEDIYIHTALQGLISGDMPSDNQVWGLYLCSLGYKKKNIYDECTVDEFARSHKNGTYILCTGTHVVCCKDGDYYDSYYSGDMLPIFYWTKEDN